MPAVRIVADVMMPEAPTARLVADLLPSILMYTTHGDVIPLAAIGVGEVTVSPCDPDHEVELPGSRWAADR